MCGIWAWIRATGVVARDHKELWTAGVSTLDSRGPEGHRFLDVATDQTWCFTRLAINGLNESAMQPFDWDRLPGGRWTWMCNGEIYNARQLEQESEYLAATGSDCEVLGALWERVEGDAVAFARALDGVFALVLYDKNRGKTIVARDPFGVRPLFYTYGPDGWMFASERKAIEPFCGPSAAILEFPPGNVLVLEDGAGDPTATWTPYHTVHWLKTLPERPLSDLREALELAVHKRMLTDRPVAALLSGGLDSSLIAALVQRWLKGNTNKILKTFSIGMEGGTDLAYARMVADHIRSNHTEIIVTPEQMLEVIPEVIRAIESYDITTVRASVGNWLVAREIRKRTDCKVVFNGDGSDEVFGGYKYFERAPTTWAFDRECERLLSEISRYDVLRSDRSISAHGLEARTPFLDKQFVGVAMSYSTGLRRAGMEKLMLRKAFDNGRDLLPREVLYRAKEAFSDGVSKVEKSWFEIIQDYIRDSDLVPVDWEARAAAAGWTPVPPTPEAYWYRSLYEENYKHTGDPWPYWMPRWSPETSDPSARTLGSGGAKP